MKRFRSDKRKLAEFQRWENDLAERVERELSSVHKRVPKWRTDLDERED